MPRGSLPTLMRRMPRSSRPMRLTEPSSLETQTAPCAHGDPLRVPADDDPLPAARADVDAGDDGAAAADDPDRAAAHGEVLHAVGFDERRPGEARPPGGDARDGLGLDAVPARAAADPHRVLARGDRDRGAGREGHGLPGARGAPGAVAQEGLGRPLRDPDRAEARVERRGPHADLRGVADGLARGRVDEAQAGLADARDPDPARRDRQRVRAGADPDGRGEPARDLRGVPRPARGARAAGPGVAGVVVPAAERERRAARAEQHDGGGSDGQATPARAPSAGVPGAGAGATGVRSPRAGVVAEVSAPPTGLVAGEATVSGSSGRGAAAPTRRCARPPAAARAPRRPARPGRGRPRCGSGPRGPSPAPGRRRPRTRRARPARGSRPPGAAR